jgi:hypothetical protein
MVGSGDHKATILYFEGGSGRIHRNANTLLINRSMYYFTLHGIKISILGFDFPNKGRGKYQVARTTDSHFQAIQKKVNNLRENGNERIWLMGLSNGAISVTHAGASGIKGVKGLIAINPPRNIYNSFSRRGTIVDFSKITLPFLLITHEEDNGNFKGMSDKLFKLVFSSSMKPEMVVFSGGITGSSAEATHLSQKYQHGLRGLEEEFAQTVINFIDSNSAITESGK